MNRHLRPGRAVAGAAILIVASAGSALAFVGITVHATVAVTVAELGAPGANAVRAGTTVVVTPVAPPSGPVPQRYAVTRQVAGASPVVVCPDLPLGTACTDSDPGADPAVSYVVTARLGTAWTRDGAPVTPRDEPADTSQLSPLQAPSADVPVLSSSEPAGPSPSEPTGPSPSEPAGGRPVAPAPEPSPSGSGEPGADPPKASGSPEVPGPPAAGASAPSEVPSRDPA